jgi:hypothetical protein
VRTVHYRNAAARAVPTPPAGGAPADPSDPSGGWEPFAWLGSAPAGGLALPDARPTAHSFYSPRGVHLGRYRGRDVLVAVDTGNHRVLIWHELPVSDHQPCDVVLGQPDATAEGPAAGGDDPVRGLNLPTGAVVDGDRLVVADAWHHRVLVYEELPSSPGARPDLVLGQDCLDDVEPNRGRACGPDTMYWPFGVAVVGGRFYVADTGNRRILGWSGGVPVSPATPPDLVLGQPDAAHREENRGGPPGPGSFRWPHDLAGTASRVLVADAGNHRVLGWDPHPDLDRPAGMVLGQPDFAAAAESPYMPPDGTMLRFPYGVDVDEGRLAVADTANNRVLLWDLVPVPGPGGVGTGPDAVLGQPGFGATGENRWSAVTHDSLCWPYGLSLRGDLLAIADAGNNRVMLWRRP